MRSSFSHTAFVTSFLFFFFFNDTATTEIYTLSLHDALPICYRRQVRRSYPGSRPSRNHRLHCARFSEISPALPRSEEHTSELQSLAYLVCRLLLEKKKNRLRTRDICQSNVQCGVSQVS